jgi:hypothetical protein
VRLYDAPVTEARVKRARKRHFKTGGKCWCGEYHGQTPRGVDAVWIDLEALLGKVRLIQFKYNHAHDFVYRAHGYGSEYGGMGKIQRYSDGREREGGTTATLSGDEKKKIQRSALHNADQLIVDLYHKAAAVLDALDNVYGSKPILHDRKARPVQPNKGDYYVKALQYQQKRRDNGDE